LDHAARGALRRGAGRPLNARPRAVPGDDPMSNASNVRRFCICLFSLYLLSAVPLVGARQAEQGEGKGAHPNAARGAASAESRHSGLIDDVNLYNGSLSLNIPIGQEYPVGGRLSYRLTLHFNSNFWEFDDVLLSSNGHETAVKASLNRKRYNAGMGWRLSLGNYTGSFYTAPDGSVHRFYHELHVTDDEPFGDERSYTRDGTYIRAIPSQRMLEFPDGEVHHFYEDGTLRKRNDRFGNELHLFKLTNPDGTLTWVLRDSANRTHYVNFNHGGHVSSVNLAAFGGSRAEYHFHYTAATLLRHKRNEWTGPFSPEDADLGVAWLTSIILPAGAGSYAFDYRNENSLREAPTYGATEDGGYYPGALRRATVPTGGQFVWTYQEYKLERRNPDLDAHHPGPMNVKNWISGVRTKQLVGLNIPTSERNKWRYHQQAGDEPAPGEGITEPRTLVESPEGDFTVNYFADTESDWHSGLPLTEAVEIRDETGKRLFLSQEIYEGAVAPANRKRAVYVRYECDMSFNPSPPPGPQPDPENPSQGLDVVDPPDNNRRLAAQRVEFYDDRRADGTPRYQQTDYSDFDGLGHYRRQETRGDFTAGAAPRVTFTNYNPENGSHNFDPANFTTTNSFDPTKGPMVGTWVLNTYTETRDSEGGKAAVREYHFDTLTGFLRKTRTLAADASGAEPCAAAPGDCPRGPHDVVVRYTRNSFGALTREEHFGGDTQAAIPDLPVADTQLLAGLTPTYQLDYSYGSRPALDLSNFDINALPPAQAYGALLTKKFNQAPAPEYFLVNRESIDGNTALSKTEKDSAGLATHFEYDALGRVLWAKPESGAWVGYNYTLNPQLTVQEVKRKNADLSASGILAQGETVFDSFGRRMEDRRRMAGAVPAGEQAWSVVETKYNAMGWKESVSERRALGTPVAGVTRFSDFDAFGRARDITPPDGAAHGVKMIYGGNRTVTRRVQLGTLPGTTPGTVAEEGVETTEVYDNYGRLVRVTEGMAGTSSEPAPQRTNVALEAHGAAASASSTVNANFPARAAINGDRRGTGWGAGTGGWADGSQGDYSSDWVRINLGPTAVTLHEVKVYTLRDGWASRDDEPTPDELFSAEPNTGNGSTDFDVQYLSSNGWVNVPGGAIRRNRNVVRTINFSATPVQTTAIRVAVHRSVPWTLIPNNYSRLVEVEANQISASGARTNLALGRGATASSEILPGFPASAVVDGDRKGRNWGNGGGWADSTENEFSVDWLRVDLAPNQAGSRLRTIDEVCVYTLQDNFNNPSEPTPEMTFSTAPNTGQGLTDFDVQYLSGSRWVTVPGGSISGNRNVMRRLTFAPITTAAIRVVVHRAATWTTIPNNYSRLVEVEAFETTVAPEGGAGAVVAEYRHDVGGRLTLSTVTAADGRVQTRSFDYDNRGFLEAEEHPESGRTKYFGYDPMGNATRQQQVNAQGQSLDPNFDLVTTYDRAGRVLEIGGANGRRIKSFSYGSGMASADRSNGKLASATRYNYHETWDREFPVVETYTYAGVGGAVSARTTQVRGLPFGAATFTQGFAYNDLGLVSSMTYPRCTFAPCNNVGAQSAQHRTVDYSYANGTLTALDERAGAGLQRYAALTYHHNGAVRKIAYNIGASNSLGWEQEIDPASLLPRPRRLVLRKDAATLWDSGTYAFDGAGNIKLIGAERGARADRYLYDRLNRLVDGEVTTQLINPATGLPFRWRQQYTYDPFGNLTRVVTFDGHGARAERAFAVSAATNRDTGSLYDAAGNTTKVGKYQMSWDGVNTMKTFAEPGFDPNNRWFYIYTADGERVASYNDNGSNVHMYYFRLRGLSNNVLREYVYNADSAVWTWTRDYVHAGKQLVAGHSFSAPGGRVYFATDHLGSVRRVLTNMGGTLEVNDFLPFGEAAASLVAAGDPLKFTGHERDTNGVGAADDLDYMHARYYSSHFGRFLSTDPGDDHDPKKPQSWHKYAYVRNNPMTLIDPTGEANELYNAIFAPPSCTERIMDVVHPDWRTQTASQFVNLVLAEAEAQNLTPARTAYTLATMHVESEMGNDLTEDYNGTPAQYFKKYDFRKSLGNTQPGDGLRFAGTGLVQATGRGQYGRAGNLVGLDLVNNPWQMADPYVAAKVLVKGMMNAAFNTGASLPEYVNHKKTDFKGARYVVNGQDRAASIANMAERFHGALFLCDWGTQ
jgi:RHS repeat-associated protein